jgi:hypothetical protein
LVAGAGAAGGALLASSGIKQMSGIKPTMSYDQGLRDRG